MPRKICSYCQLSFSGNGYSPDKEHHYCCYGCYLVEKLLKPKSGEGISSSLLLRLGIGAFLSMNVMMLSLVLYTNSSADLGVSVIQGIHWALVILSTPAIAILGLPFVFAAVRDARLGTDTLVATGSFAAYGFSTANVILGHGNIYFDTATMLLLIVTLGRLMEATAKCKTFQAIHEAFDLIPRTARILKDGQEIEIPTYEIKTGDIVVVRPGELIPIDGRIVSGSCMVEESAISGESRPRSCKSGDVVYAGSIDCDGLITVEATAADNESLIQQIQAMVKRAQSERAPIERLAERYASIFIPAIWLLALGTALYWGLFHHNIERAGFSALAMLVVACPCALGIATPIATCIAIGKAAKSGVLVRSGEVLERLPRIGYISFDKTGTLTTNQLTISEITTVDGVTEEYALILAASVESGSEHSIAKAIVGHAQQQNLQLGEIDQFEVVPGSGVKGIVRLEGNLKEVTSGLLSMLCEDHSVPAKIAEMSSSPLTTVFVGWDSQVQAAIALHDCARPEARRAISVLKDMGIDSSILSGDQEAPVRRLASEVGIENFLFRCRPGEKAAILHDTKRNSKKSAVAFVGDGINDAPALSSADVGIAIGGGTDLAKQASDITLLGDDLTRIPWLIHLSKATYRIIRQNLLWAFGYNSIAIVLAFFGYVHPLIAAFAMFASSLAVIGNSMRLLKIAASDSIEFGQTES